MDEGQKLTIEMTAKTIELGGRALSILQGCDDPIGQREYYSGLFKDLMDRLVEIGAAEIR